MNSNRSSIKLIILTIVFVFLAAIEVQGACGFSYSITAATLGTNAIISLSDCPENATLTSVGKNTGSSLTILESSKSGFLVTSHVPDTYTFYIGEEAPISPGVITFIDPLILSVFGEPVFQEVSEGDSFTLNITIQNPTNEQVATYFGLSFSSDYFSLNGDPKSSTMTLPDSTAKQRLSWTVSVKSLDFSTTTITLSLGNNNNAFTSTISKIEVPAPSPSPTLLELPSLAPSLSPSPSLAYNVTPSPSPVIYPEPTIQKVVPSPKIENKQKKTKIVVVEQEPQIKTVDEQEQPKNILEQLFDFLKSIFGW